jgi:hypothetical protein
MNYSEGALSWMERDSDFDAARELPRFKDMISAARARIRGGATVP